MGGCMSANVVETTAVKIPVANTVVEKIVTVLVAPDTNTPEQKKIQREHMYVEDNKIWKTVSDIPLLVVMSPIVIGAGVVSSPLFVVGGVLFGICWVCNGCSMNARTDNMGNPY